MNWARAAGYGLIVWLIPFAVSFAIFGIHESNRPLFESLMTDAAVITEVAAAVLFFRRAPQAGALAGLAVGILWLAISIALDLPVFLGLFRMSPALYVSDIAAGYLAIPAIATGIAIATRVGSSR
jgi:hypothetical protein